MTLITLDFGEILDGTCFEGDRMLMGEIFEDNDDNDNVDDSRTPMNFLPCRNAVCDLFHLFFFIVIQNKQSCEFYYIHDALVVDSICASKGSRFRTF